MSRTSQEAWSSAKRARTPPAFPEAWLQRHLPQAALERVVLLADRGGQVILELAEEDALLRPLVAPVVASTASSRSILCALMSRPSRSSPSGVGV